MTFATIVASLARNGFEWVRKNRPIHSESEWFPSKSTHPKVDLNSMQVIGHSRPPGRRRRHRHLAIAATYQFDSIPFQFNLLPAKWRWRVTKPVPRRFAGRKHNRNVCRALFELNDGNRRKSIIFDCYASKYGESSIGRCVLQIIERETNNNSGFGLFVGWFDRWLYLIVASTKRSSLNGLDCLYSIAVSWAPLLTAAFQFSTNLSPT